MPRLQAVVICAGEGSRYAHAVGEPTPFAKHLLLVGDKTILQRSIEGALRILPFDGITVVLSADTKSERSLQQLTDYIEHLYDIQAKYPQVAISIMLQRRGRDTQLNYDLRKRLRTETYDLSLNHTKFPEDLITAVVFGDSFLTGSEESIQRARHNLETRLPQYGTNKNLVIFGDESQENRLIHVAVLQELNLFNPINVEVAGLDAFGIQAWNINTPEDREKAESDLRLPPITEGYNNTPPGMRK